MESLGQWIITGPQEDVRQTASPRLPPVISWKLPNSEWNFCVTHHNTLREVVKRCKRLSDFHFPFFTIRTQRPAITLKLIFCVSLGAQSVKNSPPVRETWVRSVVWEDLLEKGMDTHSSILAWRTPWTEEPGGLPSMGSQRVRHAWTTNHASAAYEIKVSIILVFSFPGESLLLPLLLPLPLIKWQCMSASFSQCTIIFHWNLYSFLQQYHVADLWR